MNLVSAARQALAASAARASIFSLDGECYVAKAGGTGRGWAQAFLLKTFCRLACGCRIPLKSLRLANGQGRLDYEASRLVRLGAAGEAVPRVLAREQGLLVLEYVGNTLEQSLFPMARTEIRSCLIAATDDLARFHAAGHWHGGSQVKNMTLKNDRLFRIAR